jgi:hypothetical protein
VIGPPSLARWAAREYLGSGFGKVNRYGLRFRSIVGTSEGHVLGRDILGDYNPFVFRSLSGDRLKVFSWYPDGFVFHTSFTYCISLPKVEVIEMRLYHLCRKCGIETFGTGLCPDCGQELLVTYNHPKPQPLLRQRDDGQETETPMPAATEH